MPFNELPSYLSSDVSPIFIGGDTQSFFFDFGLKKANSTLECPLKIYEQDVSTLTTPTSGWTEITSQIDLDMLKFNDGNILTRETIAGGKLKALLIEIDLSNLCNALYGIGKNDLLKAALIKAYVNIISDNSTAYIWNGAVWNGIQLTSEATSSNITSDNKVYIGLISNTISVGVTKSSLNLEYISFKLD